jgi:hypothetical protein
MMRLTLDENSNIGVIETLHTNGMTLANISQHQQQSACWPWNYEAQ